MSYDITGSIDDSVPSALMTHGPTFFLRLCFEGRLIFKAIGPDNSEAISPGCGLYKTK